MDFLPLPRGAASAMLMRDLLVTLADRSVVEVLEMELLVDLLTETGKQQNT